MATFLVTMKKHKYSNKKYSGNGTENHTACLFCSHLNGGLQKRSRKMEKCLHVKSESTVYIFLNYANTYVPKRLSELPPP